jgi:cytochrome c-type biogenesis protein CcmH
MTTSLALAMGALFAGVAALGLVLARATAAPSDQLSDALAQLGVVRLKELERSWRGRTDEARIELLRQLLQEARSARARHWPNRGKPTVLAAVSLIALALCGLTLFTLSEEPASPPPTQAMRGLPQDPDLARLELYARANPPRQVAATANTQPAELPDVKTMIERLAARLDVSPDDAEGWRMLGWSYFNLQQPAKAVDAYARAVALQPQVAALNSAYGEAMVAAENGTVTAQAVAAFNAALALEAGNAKARYFLALAMEQGGRKREALDSWLGLLAAPLQDEPWLADLRQRAQSLARELNVDLPARVTAAPEPGKGGTANLGADKPSSTPAPRALTAQEIGFARALPADQQDALIRGMVNGLSDRLELRPRDEDGWVRLIHSRVVLGEEQAAREALSRALAVFADDASAGRRIAAAAKQLGISDN